MSDDSLNQRLQSDLTAAMKARDEVTTSTLRLVRAAIANAAVAGDRAVELSDDEILAVLAAEAKKRAEAAQIYEEAGRDEQAAKERAELGIIESYLPVALTDDELEVIVDEEIAAAGGSVDPGRAMGAVIKSVRDRVGPAADGARIAAVVRAKLT